VTPKHGDVTREGDEYNLETWYYCEICFRSHSWDYEGCEGLRNRVKAGREALNRQIASATKAVQKRARYFPHTFNEYNAWCDAKTALAEAKALEKQARAKWLAIKGTKS
jgi:hypothetical protein